MKDNSEYQDEDYEDPYNNEVYENYNSDNEYTTYNERNSQNNQKRSQNKMKKCSKSMIIGLSILVLGIYFKYTTTLKIILKIFFARHYLVSTVISAACNLGLLVYLNEGLSRLYIDNLLNRFSVYGIFN